MLKNGMTYKDSGVDYEAMDPFKRLCQLAASQTAGHLDRFGISEVEWSRGESCYLIETPWCYLAHVEEGLGTKNLVAEALYNIALKSRQRLESGSSHFQKIAQCTVAMIVNDLITLGALPVSVAMHLATGSSDWFADERRMADLIHGWRCACQLARCAWGGGETPTLPDIVYPGTVLLSGSAMGIIMPKENIIKPRLEPGVSIMLLGSSGIHANGLTLARRIADKLARGYAALLSDGQPYGEALLEPTYIYVPIIEDLMDAGVKIRYTANITGHGWRKLMRAQEPFVYVIEDIPEPQPVFRFIAEQGPVDQKEMYGNYNMGAGFALYVDEADVQKIIEVSSQHGIKAVRAGYLDRHGKDKKVIIRPLKLEYDAAELRVR